MRWLPILLALCACAPSTRVRRAQPIPKGMVEVRATVEDQGSLAGTQLEVRVGLDDDADLGVQAGLVSTGVDLRYRLAHGGGWHLAINPGTTGSWNSDYVLSEAQLPILVDRELGRHFALTGMTRVALRRLYYHRGDYPGSRTSLLPGAGARVEWHPRRFTVGLGGVVGWDVIRRGSPELQLGLDVAFAFGRWPEER